MYVNPIEISALNVINRWSRPCVLCLNVKNIYNSSTCNIFFFGRGGGGFRNILYKFMLKSNIGSATVDNIFNISDCAE